MTNTHQLAIFASSGVKQHYLIQPYTVVECETPTTPYETP
jgi:hypothetical protein